MATWTTITDAALEPGKPIRSVDGLALRDNPIAITEGAAGAPKIQNAAFSNGELGSEKFQTGTDERDWVLARTSELVAGSVGSYAFLIGKTGSTGEVFSFGQTFAGSKANYFSVNGDASNGSRTVDSPSGTWRVLGAKIETEGSSIESGAFGTLCLRIS